MTTFVSLAIAVAGWVGAIATLGAYLLVSQRRIEPDSMTFQGLNLLGAALLGVSATVNGAWPSAVVNYIWILIGLQAVMSARHMLKAGLARRAQRLQAAARARAAHLQHVRLLPRRGSVTAEEISAAVVGEAVQRRRRPARRNTRSRDVVPAACPHTTAAPMPFQLLR